VVNDGTSDLSIENATRHTHLFQEETEAQSCYFGRSGASPDGTYLLFNSTPSNIAGAISKVTGYIKKISVSQSTTQAFSLKVQTRSGAVFTDIYTVSMPSQRTYVVLPSNVLITSDNEICIKVSSSGNPREVNVGVLLKGTVL
jgi:hypothetical protein